MPVSTEMMTCRSSIMSSPPLVVGERAKNPTLNAMSNASIMMKVGFLPMRLVTGTASATPTMLATSPTPRKRPE